MRLKMFNLIQSILVVVAVCCFCIAETYLRVHNIILIRKLVWIRIAEVACFF